MSDFFKSTTLSVVLGGLIGWWIKSAETGDWHTAGMLMGVCIFVGVWVYNINTGVK